MLFTKSDVATQLKVSERTVERLAKRGDITVTKIGTCARFTQESIDQWLTKAPPFAPDPKEVISAELARMGRMEERIYDTRNM